MNNIPLTFLKDIKLTEHLTTPENLLLILGITLIIGMAVMVTQEFDRDVISIISAITAAATIGIVFATIIVIFANLIPATRTEVQYVSKALMVESISNTSESDNRVVEVLDGKKSYLITDIKGLDELEEGDRFYLKTTVESASEKDEQKERYTLNQLKDSRTKIIMIKGGK